MKLAGPGAERNPKQLPPQQQAQLAMLLDTALRYCHHCGKVAKDPVCLENLADKIELQREDEGISWPELLRVKFACRGSCADRLSARWCGDCGGEETVLGGPGNVFPRCARCSGRTRSMGPPLVQRYCKRMTMEAERKAIDKALADGAVAKRTRRE